MEFANVATRRFLLRTVQWRTTHSQTHGGCCLLEKTFFGNNRNVTGLEGETKAQCTSFVGCHTFTYAFSVILRRRFSKARQTSACDARPPSIGSRAVVPSVACHGSGRVFKTALPLCRGAAEQKIHTDRVAGGLIPGKVVRFCTPKFGFLAPSELLFLPAPIQNTLLFSKSRRHTVSSSIGSFEVRTSLPARSRQVVHGSRSGLFFPRSCNSTQYKTPRTQRTHTHSVSSGCCTVLLRRLPDSRRTQTLTTGRPRLKSSDKRNKK